MRSLQGNPKRVLAIDPCARGFGFAVLEGPERLIDWGVKDIHGDKNSGSLALIKNLIEDYEPDLVVVEDCNARGSHRRRRVRDLIQKILVFCSKSGIRTRSVPRLKVRKVFGASNKHQIATMIVARFPELAPWLPPPRKIFMAEDFRMSIFKALALALIILCPGEKRRRIV